MMKQQNKRIPWNKGLHIQSNNALVDWRAKGGTNKGKPTPWLVGRKLSEETKNKLRKQKLGRNNPMFGKTGEKSPVWKGELAGYYAIHKWIEAHLQKDGNCKSCEKIYRTHWANYSGNYKRDITDFLELCPTCHSAFDRNREVIL